MTTYKVVLFDTCCDLYVSTDSGSTFTGYETPSGTLSDKWWDMYMAVNDGDYSTVALFDEAVSPHSTDATDWTLNQGGVEIASADAGDVSSNPIYSYTAASDLSSSVTRRAVSGAITRGGATILVPIPYSEDLTTIYPRMSTDGGATWSDVTGVTIGKLWSRACFSGGGTTVYMVKAPVYAVPAYTVSESGGIWKSTDSGSTWSQLASAPTFDPVYPTHYSRVSGYTQNSLRLRCSQNGEIVAAMGSWGTFEFSTDAGATWTSKPFPEDYLGHNYYSYVESADFGMSLSGSTFVAGLGTSSLSPKSYVWLSTDSGATWVSLSPPSATSMQLYNVNISPDGFAIVVTYWNSHTDGTVDVSTDQGTTWTTTTFTLNPGLDGGVFVSAYIFGTTSGLASAPTSGDPGAGTLAGATYRRVSEFATQDPKVLGWHKHPLGHSRTMTSIGVSGETGGLLDHLDMLTTDGSNYYVEGLTQIFDEDDSITDAWFLDGALVPDSAYEDTVGSDTGIRFTGLWWLRTTYVCVFAFGLDLGDHTVDTDGTVFVPYGSGTAPSSYDYTTGGAGAYLFTSAYISANVQSTAPRNGGVYISGGYMPVVVGYPYLSQGQILRPIAPEQAGSRTGPAFGMKRRIHYYTALLKTTLGLQIGVDFGSSLQKVELKDGAGTWTTPDAPYTGIWWSNQINSTEDFDGMLSWQILRPYPCSVVSIGATLETNDP